MPQTFIRPNYGTIDEAARQARGAMDTLGIPKIGDIFKNGGGGFGGITEFGRGGEAGAGADRFRGEADTFRNQYNATRAAGVSNEPSAATAAARSGMGGFRRGAEAARSEYANPTGSAAFQAAMGLAQAKTGAASQEANRQAAEASQRRGYAGGYDPRRSDLDRMNALAEAGFAGVGQTREQATRQFGAESAGYGGALDAYTKSAASDRASALEKYHTDISSALSGYNTASGGFSDLTKTSAELPTKMMSALAPYYSSILGGAGDIFGAVLGARSGERARWDTQQGQQRALAEQARARGGAGQWAY